MISSFIGTTNIDGTGSANDLNGDNAAASVVGFDSWSGDGVSIEHLDDSSQSVFIRSDSWNKQGYKEAKVEGESESVFISNFVEIDVNLANNTGSEVVIENAKRGEVTTGDGADIISISAYSSNALWSNLFTIDSGAGNDHIVFTHSKNSQFTEFDIKAGSGDDIVDISDLSSPATWISRPSDAIYEELFGPNEPGTPPQMTRNVDGGSGFDVLKLGNNRNEHSNFEDHVMYSNFEAIVGVGDDVNLILNNEMLTHNDAANETGFGLIISNAGTWMEEWSPYFQFSLITEARALTAEESEYLESHSFSADDFISLTFETSTDTFQVFTDSDYDSTYV
ncbi:hypothetical protein INR79_25450 [Vibrio sp. SCSIO 43132]|uniref:hypothetical protein n=1 Tax=Vibrio sp. SCSIO 43132 TaxID=2779363 RepID=UPI001CA90873|nr:hypothetical protein [Vibrio sp. SCSIO 43132]UAB72607.1 hypothetical protein INR79_25450 [Vibrio sp. SCSIO 43132]